MNNFNEANMVNPLLILFACCCFAASALQCSQHPNQNRLPSKLHAAKATSRAKKLPKSERQFQNALESCLDTSLAAEKEVILIVDSNNVRGKEDFKMTNRDLLVKLKAWKSHCYPNLNIVCSIDHGSIPAVFSYDDLGLVEFAGPNRTADDVIAQSARWFSNASMSGTHKYEEENKDLDIFIVTSDGGLRTRCLRTNQSGNFKRKQKMKENVKVFASPQLLKSFEQVKDSITDTEMVFQSVFEQKVLELETDLRLYERQQPPWPSRQAKLDALTAGPWKSSILSSNDDGGKSDADSVECPKTNFQEKTWHRIVVAENMRCMMKKLSASSSLSTNKLSDLLSRYKSLHEETLSKVDLTHCSMVFDRRIRFEISLQQELIQYLEAGIASASNDKDTSQTTADESPVETAAGILKEMIRESPEKTQDQILLRFISEAPQWLQFPSKGDVRELLQFIAVREKREGFSRKQWHLLPDHASLDCWSVRPGESRRRQRRRAEKQSTRGMAVDEALLAHGADAEEQWFALVKWPRQLEDLLSSRL
jgi:hypothetical protein